MPRQDLGDVVNDTGSVLAHEFKRNGAGIAEAGAGRAGLGNHANPFVFERGERAHERIGLFIGEFGQQNSGELTGQGKHTALHPVAAVIRQHFREGFDHSGAIFTDY